MKLSYLFFILLAIYLPIHGMDDQADPENNLLSIPLQNTTTSYDPEAAIGISSPDIEPHNLSNLSAGSVIGKYKLKGGKKTLLLTLIDNFGAEEHSLKERLTHEAHRNSQKIEKRYFKVITLLGSFLVASHIYHIATGAWG